MDESTSTLALLRDMLSDVRTTLGRIEGKVDTKADRSDLRRVEEKLDEKANKIDLARVERAVEASEPKIILVDSLHSSIERLTSDVQKLKEERTAKNAIKDFVSKSTTRAVATGTFISGVAFAVIELLIKP